MKKVLVLLTGLACFLSGNAFAGFISGYGITWGSINIRIDVKGTGSTKDGDQSVEAIAALSQIEYVCLNPGNPDGYEVDGTPGTYTVTADSPLDADTLVSENGKTSVFLTIDDAELPYGDFSCVNPLWTPVFGSAVPKIIGVGVTWYDEFGTEITDSVSLHCTLDPVLRYEPGTIINGEDVSFQAIKGQEYVCMETY